MAKKRSRKNRARARARARATRRKQKGGGSSALFQDAYTISIPASTRRWEKMQELAAKAGMPLQKWDGVVIDKTKLETLPSLGIGTTTYRDRTGKVFNLGVIGAFLGHRNLLEHIAKTGQGKPGTFISEDDIDIPADFYPRLQALEGEIATHAPDWDIIFVDKHPDIIDGDKVSEHLIKLKKDVTGMKNWGIWSYIVKNSSVPTKILPVFETMMDVPDIQLARHADKINMYLIRPSLTSLDAETALSSVVTEKDVKAGMAGGGKRRY